jgi:phage terminase large subunit-like protein
MTIISTPTPWQADVLAVPEDVSLLLAGGRGSGKTTASMMDALRHCEKYKDRARVLLVRETLKSLTEVEDELQASLAAAYPRGLKINRQEHVFRLPNGATIECAPLEGVADYSKLQGRSFSLIIADEVGNFRISGPATAHRPE